ncbi:MAG: UDP-2,3-diacylglucosamine diphosphatase [Gammaproteobacteria bacterium]|nr:UDP-2,3-diacylglucosamine diphosphatase [Gammaproteobacteria bacterium]
MLLISDLHLDPNREDITRTLVDFLQDRATASKRLFILGDLFEVWVGDDAPNPLADLVARELTALGHSGTEVYLMHGNRDFLMGETFADRCGATLIDEPYIVKTPQQQIALMHGDTLCTLDLEYMKFRDMVRNPKWQQEFLSRPLEERHEIARQLRQQSQQATSAADTAIMDVSPAEVQRVLQQLQLTSLIHGHTHRPAVHTVALKPAISGASEATRTVLGDWHSQGWYAEITETNIRLVPFPLLTN